MATTRPIAAPSARPGDSPGGPPSGLPRGIPGQATAAPGPFADLAPLPPNHYGLLLHAAIARVLDALAAAPEGSADPATTGFLDGYRPALTTPAPRELRSDPTTLADWWQEATGLWEERHAPHLPLLDLRVGHPARPLDSRGRIALLIPALADEDARFGTLFARLQGAGAGPWPRVQWLGQLLAAGPAVTGVSDPWSRCRPLVDSGLLRVLDPGAARGLWALRMPLLLLDALRGDPGERPAPGLRLTPIGALPELAGLVLPEPFRAALSGAADLLAAGEVATLVLRGGAGETPESLAGALARRLGCGLLTIAPAGIEGADMPVIAPFCTLVRALPLLRIGMAGEAPGLDPYTPALPAPRLLALPLDAALPSDGRTLVLEVPELDPTLRRRVWAQALAGVPADLDAIAADCVLSAGHIPAVAGAARAALRAAAGAGRVPRLGLPQIRRAAAELNRRELGPYADRLPTAGSWSDLIAAESTRLRLAELQARCRHRERLASGLGPGFANSANRGVRALLSGPSGTGKTLAAKILAAELGLDLYRVDLASVINKYIGETEKSLRQVLGRAESLDLVLLLDEGDALLGTRTEVRSSNDRYANLQTNYLLQRLEHYQGIVVITTNLGDNIDSAFKRRMDVSVPFQPPGPLERLGILALHLPPDHAVEPAFLEQAARCALSGGQLRNAVLYAGLLALDAGVPVDAEHLYAALRSEYRKAGAAFPLEAATPAADPDWGGTTDWDGGTQADPLDAYLSALAGGHV